MYVWADAICLGRRVKCKSWQRLATLNVGSSSVPSIYPTVYYYHFGSCTWYECHRRLATLLIWSIVQFVLSLLLVPIVPIVKHEEARLDGSFHAATRLPSRCLTTYTTGERCYHVPSCSDTGTLEDDSRFK